ncbi:SMI1/KNR4 family protein [Priestia megaterium]
MWKDLIQNLSTDCVFREPASMEDIVVLEKLFSIQIPGELKTLLCETNGVNDGYGYSIIWSIEKIIRDNLNLGERMEDAYIPFNDLLFVANEGNGDMFGYLISNGCRQQNNIYVWNHEKINESRSQLL